MDTLTDLLVILFYLSALYTALGLLAAAAAGIDRLGAWRHWRSLPEVQRRPRRTRRRIDRDQPGAVRRPLAAVGRAQVQGVS